MNFSNSYEIHMEAAGENSSRHVVYHKTINGQALPYREEAYYEVRFDESLSIEFSRPSAESALRFLLCNEVIYDVAVGRKRVRLPENYWFQHELGESTFVIEEMDPEEEIYRSIFEVHLRIVPSQETLHQYRVMTEDLVQVHAGLARDVVSRTVIRQSMLEGAGNRDLQPEPMLVQLREAYEALRDALAIIGRHPGNAIQTVIQPAHYKAGDRPTAGALYDLLSSSGTVLGPSGRPVKLGKAWLRRPRLTTDLEEHRHIASRLVLLAQLSETVARHCHQTATTLGNERQRWGKAPREDKTSVYESTYLPRVELLERLALEAEDMARAFLRLRNTYRFLREAGKPRLRLSPTPLFMGRAGYREAYRVLRRATGLSGLFVDGDSIKLHYRSLASMFEYWCFVKTINWLREHYGAPEQRDTFGVVGAVYRPTLEPGQFFCFRIDDTHRLKVTYEPSILPWRQAKGKHQRYGATLTANPLRPDIMVEFLHADHVVAAMVMDSKSTTRFSLQKIRDMSDYARQIFEVETGRQPIRRVFILHRDADSDYLSNVPPRSSRKLPPTTTVFGAAACVPESVNTVPRHIGGLLRSFITSCLAWSPDPQPSEGTAVSSEADGFPSPPTQADLYDAGEQSSVTDQTSIA